ncbi:thioredoxin family protein [Spongiimicrobium salis]|uniref:thioredoxin family protein n=1 Tax=Spongiimicrobium salis TaxID=1667022 RepID=UPI00374D656A
MKKQNALIILSFFFTLSVFSQEWKTDYADALATAEKEHKPIVLVFSGSDWCGPCKRLNKSVWQSEAFKSYAKEHYVLYNADFPKKKKNQLPTELVEQNKALAEKYNPKGHYPLVLVLNENEKVLGKTGYKKMDPNTYIEHLNSFMK